ncbi:MAG: glycosyltransferase family 87 protein [Bryobacteraceae bacterium]
MNQHTIISIGAPFVVGLGVQAAFKSPSEWVEVFVPAARVLQAGGDIYFRSAYLYPPFMAFMIIPFGSFSELAARLGWFAINVVCIVGLVRSAWLLAGGSTLQSISAETRRDWAVASAGAVCSAPYILNALAHQQLDVIVGFLAVAGCLLLVRGRIISGAVLIGLAAACKGPPLLFVAYLIFRRNWLAAGLIVLVTVGANLLPDLVIAAPSGQLRLMAWVERFVVPSFNGPLGSWNGLGNTANQSLAGMVQRMFTIKIPEELIKVSAYGLMLILLATSIVAALRGQAFARAGTRAVRFPSHTALELSAVSLLMLLMSPMTDLAHLGPAMLPAFCLARIAIFRGDRIIGAAVIVAAAGALAVNKDLIGDTGYTAVTWAGVASWSMLVLWAGCVTALAQGDGEPPVRGFADSIFPFLARRSAAHAR